MSHHNRLHPANFEESLKITVEPIESGDDCAYLVYAAGHGGMQKQFAADKGAAVKLIDKLLDQTTFAGNVLEVGDTLDVHFAKASAGKQRLTHDQLELLQELFTKATWTRDARPVAAIAKRAIVAGVESFYKGE